MNVNELEAFINRQARTNVSMHGNIDTKGIFTGQLEGESTDELYAFVKYIAEARGKAFERVDFRYGRQNPPTFMCSIQFNSEDIKERKGFFKKLFG